MYEFFFEFRNKSITALAKQQNKTLMKSAERNDAYESIAMYNGRTNPSLQTAAERGAAV